MKDVRAAMNTIPIIFNQRSINRTVLGGKQRPAQPKMNVSAILINTHGSHLRIKNLEILQRAGFEKIISMEPNGDNYNLEDFVNKFPDVKFIVPQEDVTTGDLINIGMEEVSSDYVLVLNDSLSLSAFRISPVAIQKLADRKQYCYVPRLFIDKTQTLPINLIPHVEKGVLKVEAVESLQDNTPTLYPCDFIGLYNRQKFIQLGGYDYTLESPYWQNLDLSMRAWLWGERISITTTLGLSYLENAPVEDVTSNLSQFRFYLKNLAPNFVLDHGEIPFKTLFRMFRRSACGFVETINQFKDARNWVEKNQYRFKTDASLLISNWGSEK